MTSSILKVEGIEISYKREGKKVYRMTYTENGNFLNKSYVYGIGKNPYVRAYNHKCEIPADEIQLLNEVF